MTGDSTPENEGTKEPGAARFSRRTALKRGVVAGGSLIWVAPAVQVLSMTPALAQAVSPGTGTTTTTARPPGTTTTTQPGGTTTTTEAGGTTTTTQPGGTTTTTQAGGTTTTQPGGTTTTTVSGSGTTTTVRSQVLSEELSRSPGGTPQILGDPGARVLAAEASRSPAVGSTGLARTGGDLAGLAALGGASTAAGAAALAWARRRGGSGTPAEAPEGTEGDVEE